MDAHVALGAAAALVSLAFALSTLDRYERRRKPHELMWTISLLFYAAGSAALWAGAAFGWGEWTFKLFYLFGAVLTVPYLALGTVYLLGPRRLADRCAAAVSLAAAFAAGVVLASPITGAIDPARLPQGSQVFGAGPRVLAVLGSAVPSLVIVAGTVTSIVRLVRSRQPTPSGGLSPRRLALANVLITVGVFVNAAGGTGNSLLDAMDAFALSVVVGISFIFGGFLLTNLGAPPDDVAPWYPPAGERATDGPTSPLPERAAALAGRPELN